MDKARVAIFGATGGIGRAIVQAELTLGSRLLLSARAGARLDSLLDEYGSDQARTCACDLLADSATVQKALSGLGSFDRVYLITGGGDIDDFATQNASDFEAAVDLNLKAPSRVMRALLPSLQRGTRVVVVNSIAGLQTFAGWSAYCAGKWGLRALTECWREEYRAQGIQFVSVFPYATATGFWDTVPGDWDRSKMMSATQVAQQIVTAACAEVIVEELRFASPHGTL